jgi:predicted aconitase with swiveling domain
MHPFGRAGQGGIAMSKTLQARRLVEGKAEGELVVLSTPLSLWGGYDFESGTISTHPDVGRVLRDRVVALPAARGSSSASSALVESIRLGNAPAAIILAQVDPILLIGGLVGHELYEKRVPIVVIDPAEWRLLRTGDTATVVALDASALISIQD